MVASTPATTSLTLLAVAAIAFAAGRMSNTVLRAERSPPQERSTTQQAQGRRETRVEVASQRHTGALRLRQL
jgi:hypothetical protein